MQFGSRVVLLRAFIQNWMHSTSLLVLVVETGNCTGVHPANVFI